MKSYAISQRKKTRGNMTWYGREYENGVLVREFSLKTTRKADAKAWLDAMNAARFMPEAIQNRLAPVDKPISTSYSDFFGTVEATTSPATIKAYRSRLRRFLTWCAVEDVNTLREFTPEKAAMFGRSVCSSMSPKTAREMIRNVDQMMNWCADTYGMEGFNPMKNVRTPKIAKRAKDFWTPEELDRILDCAPDLDFRLFWSLMAFAGLRHAEACAFGPSSIVDGRLRVVGKGDKEAFVPVSDRLCQEIERHGCVTDGMFKRSKISHNELANDVLRESVEKAGLKPEGSSNHKFRHSFISNKIRSGVNIKAVSLLARHSDVNLTLNTYSHLLQDDLTDAANK